MANWVDYNQIKNKIDFQKVLDNYNLQFSKKGEELIGACPLPDHAGNRDNKNAFHISIDKNCFNCLTHCDGGNIIDFVRLMEKLPDDNQGFRQAALFLQEKFLSTSAAKQEPKGKIKKESDSPAPELTINEPLQFTLEKKVKYDHPFLIEEKQYPIDLVKKYGVGWCKAGLMAGRIVFPIHNSDGQLVAYSGRALTEKDKEKRGKYLFPSGFNKSFELWNFHRIKGKNKLIRDFGLIVVEGFTDALRLIQHGFDNTVALMGWSMSEKQSELIMSVTDKIALFLDNDETGRNAVKKIHQQLIHQVFIKVVPYPDDPAKIQPENFTKQDFIQALSNKKLKECEVKNGGSET